MSALGGFWRLAGDAAPVAACEDILAAQRKYGSDDTSFVQIGDIALGRNLYRILPEDAFDRQPLVSTDGNLTLVADVRLDNRDELAGELALDTAVLASTSDAAILLVALERWEERAFDRLVGAYAFALWDAQAEQLMLARDATGQRPLHFHRSPESFAFASMPCGLHALDHVPRAPDEESAARLLGLFRETRPQSFFVGIERVMPGEFALVTRAGIERRRYWKPAGPGPEPAPRDAAARLERLLDRAVGAMMRGAEDHVAVHLSAGFDSTAVAIAAARIQAERGGQVSAFTAVPREGIAAEIYPHNLPDEGPIAAATAAMYPAMSHTLVPNDAFSATALLEDDVTFYERPSLNPLNMTWGRAIDLAARERGIRVVLTGQMGNLTLSYPGRERLVRLAASRRIGAFWREARAMMASGNASVRTIVASLVSPWLHRLLPARRRKRELANARSMSALPEAHLLTMFDADEKPDPNDPIAVRVAALTGVDPGNFNKGFLAATGIDLRDPTADRRVVEFCLSLPLDAYLADGTPRRLARELLEGRVPPELLAERRKGTQAADWQRMVEAELPRYREEVAAMAASPSAIRVVDVPRLQRLLDRTPEDWNTLETMREYRLLLPRAITVGRFLRLVEGDRR